MLQAAHRTWVTRVTRVSTFTAVYSTSLPWTMNRIMKAEQRRLKS